MEIKKEVTMPATGEGTRGEQNFICIYPTLGHKNAHTHKKKHSFKSAPELRVRIFSRYY